MKAIKNAFAITASFAKQSRIVNLGESHVSKKFQEMVKINFMNCPPGVIAMLGR